MKIVILDGRPLFAERAAWSGLDQFRRGRAYQASSADEVAARASGAEILITNKAPIRADLIEESKPLRFIAVTATGFDCVDIAAARGRGIPVSNVPVYGTRSVGPVCVCAGARALPPRQLSTTRRSGSRVDESARLLDPEDAADRTGRKDDGHRRPGPDRRVHGRACPRVRDEDPGITIRFTDRWHRRNAVEWCELDDLFARSDVISLHCPLTPQTAGLVNRARLREDEADRVPDQHGPRPA